METARGIELCQSPQNGRSGSIRVGADYQGKTRGTGRILRSPSTPCKAVQTVEEVPEEETFRYFAEQVWMPLKGIAGGARPSTIAMYGFMMRVSLPKLGDKRLKDITAVDIMRYLQYLREEYRAPDGRTLSEKSIKHHYDILRILSVYIIPKILDFFQFSDRGTEHRRSDCQSANHTADRKINF